MRKYNFMRPVLIIAVAYFARSVTIMISGAAGASEELASNLGLIAMVLAAIFAFLRLTRKRKDP